MDSYPVGTEVGWTPSGREWLVLSIVVLLRRGNFLDLCVCLIKLDLRFIDFPLEVGECLVECRHFRLLDQKFLAYSAICALNDMLESVRLATVALFSAAAWSRLSRASLITTRLLDPYTPWRTVCWRLRRSSYESIKWARKDIHILY